ncbi:TRICHOME BIREFRINGENCE-LIKE 34 [Perilla frutescens var. frutescens]|nr:TRICHOME BIREFRINGENCE-LIKE 34 [Perilla frutescens var. frutescens]
MKHRCKSHDVAGVFLIALVTASLYVTRDDAGIIKKQLPARLESRRTTKEEEEQTISPSSCDLFSGKWVFDNLSYPLYEEAQCSFMLDDHACRKYGRPDIDYQKWRWRPHDCDLPRFNATRLLEKIRGKRLVFVGDSLNRNQWTSMLCLIESSLTQSSHKSVIRKDSLFIFQASEYNATIEFYWSPLLVESNCDDPFNHSTRNRIIKITSIENHARHWTDADILIFDSFIWWLEPNMTLLWGSFGSSSNAIYKKVEMRLRRYEIALNTWSDWLELNINRTKTKIFFMSLSPSHLHGESWDVLQNCYNETEPVSKEGYWGIATDREMMHIAESIIQKLEMRGLNVTYLNITNLSDYRKDAHPSIYRKFFHTPSEKQLLDPPSYADCAHWCLPGVPDVWNEILYSYIIDS